eukprot:TRINITY_DN371_c0_g1_i3.p1 TRINITY_DN371_c0_g1~~TRINITY_DN371_c0_g1_i3.p1  ORF type:complete len:565 (-),score=164.02 TRINITY_DN371_c0_g1_i3:156-1850(-)
MLSQLMKNMVVSADPEPSLYKFVSHWVLPRSSVPSMSYPHAIKNSPSTSPSSSNSPSNENQLPEHWTWLDIEIMKLKTFIQACCYFFLRKHDTATSFLANFLLMLRQHTTSLTWTGYVPSAIQVMVEYYPNMKDLARTVNMLDLRQDASYLFLQGGLVDDVSPHGGRGGGEAHGGRGGRGVGGRGGGRGRGGPPEYVLRRIVGGPSTSPKNYTVSADTSRIPQQQQQQQQYKQNSTNNLILNPSSSSTNLEIPTQTRYDIHSNNSSSSRDNIPSNLNLVPITSPHSSTTTTTTTGNDKFITYNSNNFELDSNRNKSYRGHTTLNSSASSTNVSNSTSISPSSSPSDSSYSPGSHGSNNYSPPPIVSSEDSYSSAYHLKDLHNESLSSSYRSPSVLQPTSSVPTSSSSTYKNLYAKNGSVGAGAGGGGVSQNGMSGPIVHHNYNSSANNPNFETYNHQQLDTYSSQYPNYSKTVQQQQQPQQPHQQPQQHPKQQFSFLNNVNSVRHPTVGENYGSQFDSDDSSHPLANFNSQYNPNHSDSYHEHIVKNCLIDYYESEPRVWTADH